LYAFYVIISQLTKELRK